MEADGDPDGETDSAGGADATADGAAETDGSGLGEVLPVSNPPPPARSPNARIAANTTTVEMTKKREALSVTRTASSD